MHSREENAAYFAHLLDHYGNEHRHPGHRWLVACCLLLLAWSAIALAWTIPVPPMLGRPGFWSVMLQVLLFSWYWKYSRHIGAAMFVAMLVLSLLTHLIYSAIDPIQLRGWALGIFLLAWLGVMLGRFLEHPRPRLRDELAGVLVGCAWFMDRLLQRLGISR
jgi:Protein of unknown function (DUF962)